MATRSQLQDLLRFLTNDVKLNLATAMGKVKGLQEANLVSVTSLSTSNIKQLKEICNGDEKVARQILNAAKRINKKNSTETSQQSSTTTTPPAPSRKKRKYEEGEFMSPAALEESLSLPTPITNMEEISQTILFTNRAPLMLAFAVTLLKYTFPTQPISSRLSLAQAVVSANSRTKAIRLGIEHGRSAEEEGWGEGQPSIRVMSREIKVMRRWGYDPTDAGETSIKHDDDPSTAATIMITENKEPALWGVDLEAMRGKSGAPIAEMSGGSIGDNLPIYTPQSARAYLLKSFNRPPNNSQTESNAKLKKPSQTSSVAEKERNLALLLGALDLVFQSWVDILDPTELDRKAWSWYVQVRPEVENGIAGWGGKGPVALNGILELRRDTRDDQKCLRTRDAVTDEFELDEETEAAMAELDAEVLGETAIIKSEE